MIENTLSPKIVAVLLGALLSILWTKSLTSSPVSGDAAHTLQMATNLAHHGIASIDHSLQPSMYREPLPVFISAAAVLLVDAVHGPAEHIAYRSGERARLLKLQNIGWMFLLATGVFAAVRLITGSTILAAVAMLAVNVRLPAMPTGLPSLGFDTLESDLPAAALLTWASLIYARAVISRRASEFAVAGILFGCLALVKAAFLYVFVGVLGITPLLWIITPERLFDFRRELIFTSSLAICFVLVVTPWIARNFVHFGTLSIAERGGVVLLIRAEKDLMTADEYKGSFYAWAPQRIQPVVGRILGYNERDMQRGGRLQRLNRSTDADFYPEDLAAELAGKPDEAITYYRKARAQRVMLERELLSSVEADEQLQRRALNQIRAHPGSHLAVTVPFLWRGAFIAAPALLITLIFAISTRGALLVAFALPALGLTMFYGLLSHFIPRYGVPTAGIVVAILLVILQAGCDAIVRHTRLSEGTRTSGLSVAGTPLEQKAAKPRVLIRAFWFAVAGIVTICLNPALFMLFHDVLAWNHYVAYGLSLTIVNVLQFFWNYFIGFKSQQSIGNSAKRQLVTFGVANVVNYVLVVALQAMLPQWKLYIIVLVQVAVAGLKFIAYHYWVYPERHQRHEKRS